MQRLADYELLSILHQGDKYNVYQARDLSSQQEVILKATRAQFPSLEEIASLKREMEFSRLVNTSGVIRSLNLDQVRSTFFLVQENIGGITLKTYLKNFNITLEKFLKIAISLAGTLAHIHSKKIIHKDIKPGNIIINPESGEVKITDFSISTRLSEEAVAYSSASSLGGTLAYMSPEQTGRVNRSIDYRSDLYSLGITFFEMLSGRLPFKGKTPIEMVCHHIATLPENLRILNPEIPEVITQIVDKLLQKNAEDRYQSAMGLKHDLERCQDLLKQGSLNKGFPIGEVDFSFQFQLPQKLYGRKQEVDQLLKAFWRAQNKTQAIWINGSPGVGKTALVYEVHSPITKRRGIFISGKFDQYQNNIPYSAIGQAFNRFCDYILGEPLEVLSEWKTKLLKALSGQGQVLIDLFPHLETIIGKQTKPTLLEAKENEKRLVQVFQNFLNVVCTPQHPIVLFLDDMQWADLSSLSLLEKLLSENLDKSLLFIGSYRDNEVHGHHPLISLSKKLNLTSLSLEELHLNPLTQTDVMQILQDSLHRQAHEVSKLTGILFNKTQGNPFFIRQMLKSFYDEGCLRFSFEKKEWQWDLKELEEKNFSESVVELLLQKIRRLPPTTQKILQLAAILGNAFELSVLAKIAKQNPSQCLEILWQGVEDGLLRPLDNNYRLISTLGGDHSLAPKADSGFQFAHDRIQEAVYSLVSEKDTKPLHFKIGKLLNEGQKKEEKIYEIVSHFQKSADLISSEQEKTEIANIALAAAKKAGEASAFDNALNYAHFGISLLKEEAWQNQHSLIWQLHYFKASNEFSAVKLEDSATTLRELLPRSVTQDEKVAVYKLYSYLLDILNQNVEGVKIVLEGLRFFKIKVPRHFLFLHILYQFFKFRRWVKKDPSKLEKLPKAKDPKVLSTLELAFSGMPHFGQAAPELLQYVSLRMANFCIQHGNSIYASPFYALAAAACASFSRELSLSNAIAQSALNIIAEYPDVFPKGMVYFIVGNFIHHWKNSPEESMEFSEKAFQICRRAGVNNYATYALYFIRLQNVFFNSRNLTDITKENEECYNAFLELGDKELALNQNSLLNYLSRLSGTNKEFKNLELIYNDEDYEKNIVEAKSDVLAAQYYLIKVIEKYLQGNFGEAFQYAKKSNALVDRFWGAFGNFLERWFFLLAYYGSHKKLTFWQKLPLLGNVVFNRILLRKFAKQNPDNFLSSFLLVQAEAKRVRGKTSAAAELYEKAIQITEERGWAFPLALSYQLAGRFYLQTNKTHLAKVLLREAGDIYHKWGAEGIVADLKTKYPGFFTPTLEKDFSFSNMSSFLRNQKEENRQLLEDLKVQARKLTASEKDEWDKQQEAWLEQTFSKFSETFTPAVFADFDFQTLLKSAYTLLGEIRREPLIKKFFKTILEHSSAGRVCFLQEDDQELMVIAEQYLGDSETIFMEDMSLNYYHNLPGALIHYVSRVKEMVVMNDVSQESRFKENYLKGLIGNPPKSLLTIPIVYHDDLLGILYLENDKITGAFPEEMQSFLELLSVQIAIALKNAKLYLQKQ